MSDDTTTMTDAELAEAAERESRPDTDSTPTDLTDAEGANPDPEALPLPDYATDAIENARETSVRLAAAVHAAATRGNAIDKTEVDRQTTRLQAQSTYALVELLASGVLTPPVATIETFNTFELTAEGGYEVAPEADATTVAEGENPDTKPENPDAESEGTTAKKGTRKS